MIAAFVRLAAYPAIIKLIHPGKRVRPIVVAIASSHWSALLRCRVRTSAERENG